MAIDFEQDAAPEAEIPVTEIEIVQGPEEVGTEDQPKDSDGYTVLLP